MPDKDTMRRMAMILVGQIVAWGGQGKDIAAFLGVSATTISHWHTLGDLGDRKPAIPTDEHIKKLIAIFQFRVQQNLSRLTQVLNLEAFDPKTTRLVAHAIEAELKANLPDLERQSGSNSEELDELFEQLKTIQGSGANRTLRSLLNPIAKWGEERSDEEDIPDIDEPIDLDQVRTTLEPSAADIEQIDAYAIAFRNMLVNEANAQIRDSIAGRPPIDEP